MTISKKKDFHEKLRIDLTGPQGNAFCLLGCAKDLGKQLRKSKEEQERIQKEMMAADYENLVKVFDREFGEYVDLIR